MSEVKFRITVRIELSSDLLIESCISFDRDAH